MAGAHSLRFKKGRMMGKQYDEGYANGAIDTLRRLADGIEEALGEADPERLTSYGRVLDALADDFRARARKAQEIAARALQERKDVS